MMEKISGIFDHTSDYEEKARQWLKGGLVLCGMEDTYQDYKLTEKRELAGNKVEVVFRRN